MFSSNSQLIYSLQAVKLEKPQMIIWLLNAIYYMYKYYHRYTLWLNKNKCFSIPLEMEAGDIWYSEIFA